MTTATASAERYVRVAEWALERQAVIVTLGLGSCVAIMLHDPEACIGAMAHVLLLFAQLMTPGTVQMGERNIAASRAALREAAIPIIGEAVGGDRGRSVRFWPQNGRVETRTVGGEDVLI